MTRILVWFWSHGGGGSQFAVHLANRLSREFGADAVGLSMLAEDPTIAAAEALGLQVLRADVTSDRRRRWATLAGLAGGASAIRRHVRAFAPDVVVVAMNFAVAAALALTQNAPLVYCAHDPDPHPGDFAALGQRLTQAVLLKRAHTIVALSQFAASRLRRRIGRRVQHAPLSSVFMPSNQPSPPRPGPVNFLCVGRMMEYKGLDLLEGALPMLSARTDWRLTVAGQGPALTDATMARLIEKGVEVRREFLQEREIDALIDSSDVLLAPYKEASQSGVVAQALARGRPALVTPVGALAEQIEQGRGGWIAEAASAQAFGARWLRILDDAEARGQRARGASAIAREAWEGPHWAWLDSYRKRA